MVAWGNLVHRRVGPACGGHAPAGWDHDVHFLSVYFFSVYTRPTSVELGRHSLSSNFWRRQRHPFLRPSKKKKPNLVQRRGCLLFILPPGQISCPDLPCPPSPGLFACFPCTAAQATGYPVTALAPCRTAASGCAVGFPWLAAGAPSALGKGSLMRTAILPGMHLNPSDFRS